MPGTSFRRQLRCREKQIISEGWISEMTKPREVESKYFRRMKYGYLWWIIHPEKRIYAAIGNSGNVIYVNPEKEIVVAVSSYFKPTVFDRVDLSRILFFRVSDNHGKYHYRNQNSD